LTTTYRCPRAVVALAARIVPDYTAAPTAPEGTVLMRDEAAMMATAEPSDFVLSRTNAPLARIALAFLRANKPARIEGRDISKTLLALVRRMKAETIPDMTAKLARWAERESDKVRNLRASEAARQARLDMIADQVATLDALSDGLAETAELEARIGELFTERGPAIMCSTVHRAKGLEAERVFVLTDTLYCNGKRQSEEESNIHYVALTRAKSTLVLVSEKGGI
jgi:ATP-dependent exoDNAse (exonuclease V) beta subunit